MSFNKDGHMLTEAYHTIHESEKTDLVDDLIMLMNAALDDPNAFRELAEPYGGIKGYIEMLDSKLDKLLGEDDYASIVNISDPEECRAKGHFWCTVHNVCKPMTEENVERIDEEGFVDGGEGVTGTKARDEVAAAAARHGMKGGIAKGVSAMGLGGAQAKNQAEAAKAVKNRIKKVLPKAIDLYNKQTKELMADIDNDLANRG